MEGLNDKDYFSRLPNELVGQILMYIDTGGPLSKRFLPFFRRDLYRVVWLNTFEALALFCRTARSHSGLLSITEPFTFEVKRTPEEVDDDLDVDEIDPGTSSDEDLLVVLHSLQRLECLQIIEPGRFAKLACRTEVAFPFSETLEELWVDFPSERCADPFQPHGIVDLLARYPALEDFTYEIPNHSNLSSSPLPSSRTPLPQTPVFNNLRNLVLEADLSNSSLFPSLASYFPAVTSLALTDLSLVQPLDRIFDFLDRLLNPQNIETLNLNLGDQSHKDMTSLPRILVKFTSLKVLELPEIPLDDLYPVLPNLPLQRLKFGINRSLTALEVSRFLSGPTKIPTLEVVELDTLEDLPAKEGARIPGGVPPRDVDYPLLEALGWRYGSWTDEFELDHFDELVKVAEREGIRLEGGTVDARRVEDCAEREVTRHRAYWRSSRREQGSRSNRTVRCVFVLLALAQHIRPLPR
ncbi:hypothetical protein JCM5353_007039 [Sporobolomyces roseus]